MAFVCRMAFVLIFADLAWVGSCIRKKAVVCCFRIWPNSGYSARPNPPSPCIARAQRGHPPRCTAGLPAARTYTYHTQARIAVFLARHPRKQRTNAGAQRWSALERSKKSLARRNELRDRRELTIHVLLIISRFLVRLSHSAWCAHCSATISALQLLLSNNGNKCSSPRSTLSTTQSDLSAAVVGVMCVEAS